MLVCQGLEEGGGTVSRQIDCRHEGRYNIGRFGGRLVTGRVEIVARDEKSTDTPVAQSLRIIGKSLPNSSGVCMTFVHESHNPIFLVSFEKVSIVFERHFGSILEEWRK